MRFLKFVAPCLSGGMMNNTIKTHLVLHIAEDILNFGVPKVMNSLLALLNLDTSQFAKKPPGTHRSDHRHSQCKQPCILSRILRSRTALLTFVTKPHKAHLYHQKFHHSLQSSRARGSSFSMMTMETRAVIVIARTKKPIAL